MACQKQTQLLLHVRTYVHANSLTILYIILTCVRTLFPTLQHVDYHSPPHSRTYLNPADATQRTLPYVLPSLSTYVRTLQRLAITTTTYTSAYILYPTLPYVYYGPYPT